MKSKFLGTFSVEEAANRIGKKPKKLTHISLFTGIGGFDIGFAKAGIENRVMIEFDKYCCQTLRANFFWEELKKRTDDKGKPLWKNKRDFLKKVRKSRKSKKEFYKTSQYEAPEWYNPREPVIFERDIKDVKTEEILKAADLEIGQCGIISGGSPCQGFSLAGKRMIDDPRNFLFKEMVRIIKGVLPRYMIFENVPGLQSLNKGKTIKEMCEEFANCGYDLVWKILNAADYGVPQNRKRIFMIGTRIDTMMLPEKGNARIHIAAMPGEIRYPKQWMDKYGKKLGVVNPEQTQLQWK